MPVTTFSVTYEIPRSPERIAEIEQEISRVELTLANALAFDSSADRKEADLALMRLRVQMEPEKRTVPARQDTHDGLTDWYCTRPECKASIASVIGDSIESDAVCGSCGATVIRQDLPMSLDLYRMRTRRTDGADIQAKPQL